MSAQLFHQMSAVNFDRARADGEIERDHLIRFPVHQAEEHVLFPRGQPIDLLPRLDQCGVAPGRFPHLRQRLIDRHHDLFRFARVEQAIGRARLHRLDRDTDVAPRRQQDAGEALAPTQTADERCHLGALRGIGIEEDHAPLIEAIRLGKESIAIAKGSCDHVGPSADRPMHLRAAMIVAVDDIAVDETRRWWLFERCTGRTGDKNSTHPVSIQRVGAYIGYRHRRMTMAPAFSIFGSWFLALIHIAIIINCVILAIFSPFRLCLHGFPPCFVGHPLTWYSLCY